MVGMSFDNNDDKQQGCARFVCSLYGHSGEDTDSVRFKLFCSKNSQTCHLQPAKDALRYHVNMAKSPGMHLPPVLESRCSQLRWSWLLPGWGSPFYPLDGLAARTKGSPATPQLQRQERPLPWQKVLMPQEWHVVHWCLGMQRMCQSTQHCSHWGLQRWGWSVNDWLVLGTRLVTGHTVICRQKFRLYRKLVKHWGDYKICNKLVHVYKKFQIPPPPTLFVTHKNT